MINFKNDCKTHILAVVQRSFDRVAIKKRICLAEKLNKQVYKLVTW